MFTSTTMVRRWIKLPGVILCTDDLVLVERQAAKRLKFVFRDGEARILYFGDADAMLSEIWRLIGEAQ